MKSNFKKVGLNDTIVVKIDTYDDDKDKTILLLEGHGAYDYHFKAINKRQTRFFVTTDLKQVSHLYNMMKNY